MEHFAREQKIKLQFQIEAEKICVMESVLKQVIQCILFYTKQGESSTQFTTQLIISYAVVKGKLL